MSKQQSSAGKKTLIASVIWMASMFLSRIIGLVREGVLGRTLGGGADADVYFTSFVLPDFLGYMFAGGALSIVYIPIMTRYLQRGDEEGAWNSFSRIVNVLGVLVLVTRARPCGRF